MKRILVLLLVLVGGAAVVAKQPASPQTKVTDGGAPEPNCIPGDPSCKP